MNSRGGRLVSAVLISSALVSGCVSSTVDTTGTSTSTSSSTSTVTTVQSGSAEEDSKRVECVAQANTDTVCHRVGLVHVLRSGQDADIQLDSQQSLEITPITMVTVDPAGTAVVRFDDTAECQIGPDSFSGTKILTRFPIEQRDLLYQFRGRTRCTIVGVGIRIVLGAEAVLMLNGEKHSFRVDHDPGFDTIVVNTGIDDIDVQLISSDVPSTIAPNEFARIVYDNGSPVDIQTAEFSADEPPALFDLTFDDEEVFADQRRDLGIED